MYNHIYIYASPKKKVLTAVGVDVLDLTHINFRMFVFG